MSYKTSRISAGSLLYGEHGVAEPCNCLSLFSLKGQPCAKEGSEEASPTFPAIPVPPALQQRIETVLHSFYPSSQSLSILLVHISQLEQVHISPDVAIPAQRQRYHAPSSFLTQVLENVRRAIRNEDKIVVDEGRGAMILFPDVDQHGISAILERVYYNVNLLQSETVIPPLQRETDIFIGTGTFSSAKGTGESFQFFAGSTTHCLTLRPAIRTQLWEIQQGQQGQQGQKRQKEQKGQQREKTEEQLFYARKRWAQSADSAPASNTAPFMRLPAKLPTRLRHLLPYDLALELRAVPVGRAHFRLTVAMADPTDKRAIARLHEHTGMSIFPVSCAPGELDALLASAW